MDPDCFGRYNNIYCSENISDDGTYNPMPWSSAIICGINTESVFCNFSYLHVTLPECENLPLISPEQLALPGYGPFYPPPEWVCDPGRYFDKQICDCGCGVYDPDCGYQLRSCDDETWNPDYSEIFCEGLKSYVDMVFCRLETASCATLPPGLARGSQSKWTCIPEVYNEFSVNTTYFDCNCNCGDLDPDCLQSFESIICSDQGIGQIEYPSNDGVICVVGPDDVSCVRLEPLIFTLPDAMKITVLVFVGFSVCICGFLYWFIRNYRVSNLSFRLTSLSLLGALVLSLAALLFVVDVTHAVCLARCWTISLGFCLFLGPYFFNTFRILEIFQASNGYETTLSENFLLACTGIFVCGQVAINALTTLGETQTCYYLIPINQVDTSNVNCCAVRPDFVIATLIYAAALLFWGIKLGCESRKLPESFNNASPIEAVLVFILCYLLVFFPVQWNLKDPQIVAALRCIGILVGLWISLAFIYLPRMLKVWEIKLTKHTPGQKSRDAGGVVDDSTVKIESNTKVETTVDSAMKIVNMPNVENRADAKTRSYVSSLSSNAEMEIQSNTTVNLILACGPLENRFPRGALTRKGTANLQNLESMLALRLKPDGLVVIPAAAGEMQSPEDVDKAGPLVKASPQ
jgi:hypothetical protein